MSHRRRYLAGALVLAIILMLAAAALAGPGDQPGQKGLQMAATHVPDQVTLPTPESHVPDQAESESSSDSHGACVSAVARSDERAALEEGWRRGLLVSSVASDESMTGADCDFSAHLTDAQNAEGPGGSAEAGSPESAGNDTSQEAREDGRAFGDSKRAEHSP